MTRDRRYAEAIFTLVTKQDPARSLGEKAKQKRLQNRTIIPTIFPSTIGKLNRWTDLAAADPPLLLIPAKLGSSTCQFVINTGASVSIVPLQLINGIRLQPIAVQLTSANNLLIKVYGECNLEIKLRQLLHSDRRIFVIADIMNSLLGLDFLTHFNLLVDCAAIKMTDRTTSKNTNNLKVLLKKTNITKINRLEVMPTQGQEILKKSPSLVAPKTGPTEVKETKVFHHIDSNDFQLIFCKCRQQSTQNLIAVQKETY